MKEADIRDRSAFARYLELVRQDIATYFPDPSRFQTVACPACDGSQQAFEFVKSGFPYVTCAACETLFVNPRPAPELLAEFYRAAPSSRYWIDGFFRPVAESRREKIFRPRAQYVARRLGHCKSGTVADVGAGFALFLEELRNLWPETSLVAIEPSPEMAAIGRAKGFVVEEHTIESLAGHAGRFQLVTAFELLEHLHEPRLFLKKAFDLLCPGGYLLATTLSGRGFDVQILWERSNSVSPPHHLNFFAPESLAQLVTRTGFVVEEICTPGELDWDIVEGAVLKDGMNVDRFWRGLARSVDVACKRDLQQWLSRHKLSSHMRILARKP